MPESESFDAFYARTVWNVTSQMHALAGEDSVADHAIREAYARAYQQWYEVAGHHDSEAWVLGVAKDAYQRRLTEAGALSEPKRAPGHDPLSWPGMFRPVRPAAQPSTDPEATLAPRPGAAPGPAAVSPGTGSPGTGSPGTGSPGTGSPGTGSPGTGSPAVGPADSPVLADPVAADAPLARAALADVIPGGAQAEVPPGSLFGSPAQGGGGLTGDATADWDAQAGPDAAGPAFRSVSAGPAASDATPGWRVAPGATTPTGRTPGSPPWGRMGGRAAAVLSSRRNVIAIAAAAAVLLAGGIVYALGGQNSGHGATPGVSASGVAKPTAHMLPAGRTGTRAAIPWSLIGPGWTLAEVSTAQPDADGAAAGGGRYVIYLVDPEGGKYRIRVTSGASAPDLLGWSGNARTALYDLGRPASGAPAYGLLTLASGQLTPLPLPAGVTAIGFTRPDGLNILAVGEKGSKYRLERFNLAGVHQATIGSLPRPAGASDVLQGNALSSPDGTMAVWGVIGDEMQLVSNAGGLIRRLRVPDAASPPACTPISWWSSASVLAYCTAAGSPDAGRLWLVPANGSQATPLSGISGSASGIGDLTGAWQAGGAVYITSTTSAQCTTAASGPGGQQILQLAQGGAETSVAVPDTTNNHAAVVGGGDGRLLVLAQTSCPGTSSLLWLNPATHAAQTVLTAPATEVGVIDAVPYGSGPAATTDGLN